MTENSRLPTDNGAARPTREQMAVHSVRAQLHAIRAQVDGALASLALLDGPSTAMPQPNARRIDRPATEAEALFFGKLRAGQIAAPDEPIPVSVGESTDAS